VIPPNRRFVRPKSGGAPAPSPAWVAPGGSPSCSLFGVRASRASRDHRLKIRIKGDLHRRRDGSLHKRRRDHLNRTLQRPLQKLERRLGAEDGASEIHQDENPVGRIDRLDRIHDVGGIRPELTVIVPGSAGEGERNFSLTHPGDEFGKRLLPGRGCEKRLRVLPCVVFHPSKKAANGESRRPPRTIYCRNGPSRQDRVSRAATSIITVDVAPGS
jgi:hypothetical protein